MLTGPVPGPVTQTLQIHHQVNRLPQIATRATSRPEALSRSKRCILIVDNGFIVGFAFGVLIFFIVVLGLGLPPFHRLPSNGIQHGSLDRYCY